MCFCGTVCVVTRPRTGRVGLFERWFADAGHSNWPGINLALFSTVSALLLLLCSENEEAQRQRTQAANGGNFTDSPPSTFSSASSYLLRGNCTLFSFFFFLTSYIQVNFNLIFSLQSRKHSAFSTVLFSPTCLWRLITGSKTAPSRGQMPT